MDSQRTISDEDLRALPTIVADRAATDPERLLLKDTDGHGRTYREVHEAGLRWAARLRDLGVERGATVAVMLPTSFDAIEVWLGIAWLGAIEVPINTGYRGRMLEHVLDDSTTSVVVTTSRFADVLQEPVAARPDIATVVQLDGADADFGPGARVVDGTLTAAGPMADDVAPPAEHDIAVILYTSGTTGPSKGVMVPWAQLGATATGSLSGVALTEHDVSYAPYPMYHVSGIGLVYTVALVGGHCVLKDQFKTDEFWADVRQHGCTLTLLLGAVVQFLAAAPERPDDADNPLRLVLMVPVIADVERFLKRFDVQACTVFNMTETSCPLQSDGTDLGPAGSCGRPRPGYQVRLVDEHDREVPPGELGELVVRSDRPWTQMAGYWRRPEATVDAWRNQWLHTGDGFVRDEHDNYFFVDRQKDAIRRRGENISSFEVEAHVNDHPDVVESAAVAVPSEWGEDEVKVDVVLRPGADLTPTELHAWLRERMTRFMVPRYIQLRPELPKTPTQKIRKVELRADGINPDTWDAATAP
ncbi:MAG: AMP-binding protein [Acidimicrobiales bacterium]